MRGVHRPLLASQLFVQNLAFEKNKASVRTKVEHPFHVIKNLFGYRKVHYKRLIKY